MSAELMIAALRRGKNGNEILAILDAVTGSDDNVPAESVSAEPTLEPIEFWFIYFCKHLIISNGKSQI